MRQVAKKKKNKPNRGQGGDEAIQNNIQLQTKTVWNLEQMETHLKLLRDIFFRLKSE